MRRLVAGAVVACCLLVWWWWPSEESRIRSQIDRMAAALDGRGDETDLERVARIASIASGLAPDVTVQAGAHALAGRDAVVAAVRAWAGARRAVAVDIEDADIVVTPDSARAEAHVIARIDDDYQELSVSLRREDGTWLVDGVRADAPLRRPQGVSAP
jgi:hypothetical protein